MNWSTWAGPYKEPPKWLASINKPKKCVGTITHKTTTETTCNPAPLPDSFLSFTLLICNTQCQFSGAIFSLILFFSFVFSDIYLISIYLCVCIYIFIYITISIYLYAFQMNSDWSKFKGLLDSASQVWTLFYVSSVTYILTYMILSEFSYYKIKYWHWRGTCCNRLLLYFHSGSIYQLWFLIQIVFYS